MPSLRGIEICIVGDPDYQKLPEFPHPDSSTVSLPRPNSHRQFHIHPSQQQGNGPPAGSESHDPARLAKARPTASVYIASIPGSIYPFIPFSSLNITDLARRPILDPLCH